MIGKEHASVIIGAMLYGPNAAPIGAIGQVYLDDESDTPAWVTVHTGLFGTHESFVPLSGARVSDEGVVVGFSPDLVKDAPRADPAGGHLEAADEAGLYRHYGLSHGEEPDRESDWPSRPQQGRAAGGQLTRRLRRYAEPGNGRLAPQEPSAARIDLDVEQRLRRS